jgi:hypothetical protein
MSDNSFLYEYISCIIKRYLFIIKDILKILFIIKAYRLYIIDKNSLQYHINKFIFLLVLHLHNLSDQKDKK